MGIIRKSLGNNREVITKAFRGDGFDDGLGGIRFNAYVKGWAAGWAEYKKYKQDSHDGLVEALKQIHQYCIDHELWDTTGVRGLADEALKAAEPIQLTPEDAHGIAAAMPDDEA